MTTPVGGGVLAASEIGAGASVSSGAGAVGSVTGGAAGACAWLRPALPVVWIAGRKRRPAASGAVAGSCCHACGVPGDAAAGNGSSDATIASSKSR